MKFECRETKNVIEVNIKRELSYFKKASRKRTVL